MGLRRLRSPSTELRGSSSLSSIISDNDGIERTSASIVSNHLLTVFAGSHGNGYPGGLTETELETCLKFREELKRQDCAATKEMVMAMHPYEMEAFALCRFLRARDFNMEKVFKMMEEKNQSHNWRTVHEKDPDLFRDFNVRTVPEFNGCPLPVLLSLIPMIHSGIGKNGAIVLYFRAGKVNCPGIECVVGDLTNALPFVWNRLYHGCRDALAREIKRLEDDPARNKTTTVLAEKIMVVDLEGDSSLFTSGMSFYGVAPQAGACFPETVNRTYVLNAPFSFSLVWKVIKQALDPRTVQKVGFFSTVDKAKTDFFQHLHSSELLSEYGGTGRSFEDVLAQRQRELSHKPGVVVRYVVELVRITGGWGQPPPGFEFAVSNDDETVDSIVVYSRSDNSCELSVVDTKQSSSIVDSKTVSREEATSKASSDENDIPHNNYAVEIAASELFAAAADAGSSTRTFSVSATNGTKGDTFLVMISIATTKR